MQKQWIITTIKIWPEWPEWAKGTEWATIQKNFKRENSCKKSCKEIQNQSKKKAPIQFNISYIVDAAK